MKTIVRKDEQAVSPVIATILMVAITVVLAAVLYVMVSGLIGGGPGGTPNQIGMTRTSSGGNWILTVTSVTGTMTSNQVLVTLAKSDGTSTNVSSLALTSVTMATKGIVYQPAGSSGNIAAADTILLSQTWWPSSGAYRITLTYSTGIVYGPTTLS